MVTIIASPGPRVLGEILQPHRLGHSYYFKRHPKPSKECLKCGLHYKLNTANQCKYPDPIDIKDSNVARKFRDKAVEKWGWIFFQGFTAFERYG